MTKPTSRLEWWPDAANPLAVRASWFGAGWHYTLEWGHLGEDGEPATDPMMFWDPPIRHVYPRAGAFTLVGRPGLHASPVSTVITLRSTLKPEASFELLPDGRTVRATLQRPDDQVRWRVAWGDNTLTEHDVNDLQPTHTYAWNTGTPTITVTDLPARRSARFTGPEIGLEPPPPTEHEYQGFCVEHLEASAGLESRRYRLHGGGMVPGEEVTIYPYNHNWKRVVNANAKGEIHETVDMWLSKWGADWDMWRSFTVRHGDRVVHVPTYGPSMEAGTPEVTYQVDPTNTRRLTFSVFPAMPGRHTITYGDGTSDVVDVEKLPLLATHTYSGTASQYAVTVTLPDGRTAERIVIGANPCPPCFNANYPGEFDTAWHITGNWCGACGQKGGEDYSPVEITMSGGPYDVLRIHKPERGSSWHCTYQWRNIPVGRYTLTYVTALTPPKTYTVNVDKAAKIRTQRSIVEATKVDTLTPLSAWFGVTSEWDGGYSGEFHVHNQDDQPTPWAVEFQLAEPAVLREVWPRTANYTELPDNRWRIYSDAPAPAGGDVKVGARIEPPGKTRKWPDQLHAKPWSKPIEDAGSSSSNEGGA